MREVYKWKFCDRLYDSFLNLFIYFLLFNDIYIYFFMYTFHLILFSFTFLSFLKHFHIYLINTCLLKNINNILSILKTIKEFHKEQSNLYSP